MIQLRHLKVLLFSSAATLLLTTTPTTSAAQYGMPAEAGRPHLTRTELQDLLGRLEEVEQSPSQSSEARSHAADEAAMVRGRLEHGDMRVGDQIGLTVEGEDALTNTFVVKSGQVMTLPGIGDIPLQGVLRSELESHLTSELSRFIREPVVHAEALVRVTITGEVGNPGFYGIGAERLLSDLIMEAGGPTPNARLEDLYIERAGERIWEGEQLREAVAAGRTLDQLSLQAGDQVVLPAKGRGFSSMLAGVFTGVLSVAAIIVTIMKS